MELGDRALGYYHRPEDAATFRWLSRRRSPPDPLTDALVGAARACGPGGPVAAAILGQGPQVQPLLEAFEARRWADANRFRAFDATRDNVLVYLVRAGAVPCAAVAVLDPLEPYAGAQLLRPPVTLTDGDRAALGGLALVGDWKPLA